MDRMIRNKIAAILNSYGVNYADNGLFGDIYELTIEARAEGIIDAVKEIGQWKRDNPGGNFWYILKKVQDNANLSILATEDNGEKERIEIDCNTCPNKSCDHKPKGVEEKRKIHPWLMCIHATKSDGSDTDIGFTNGRRTIPLNKVADELNILQNKVVK